MTQPDDALQLTCTAQPHQGPRLLPRGWFPKSGKGRRSSWCRVCLRPLRAAHQASRRGAGVTRVDPNLVGRLWTKQAGVCGCGCDRSLRFGYHIDHRIPIAKGGRHEETNLQLLSPKCNLRFGAKLK